jgi:hypothetical protein
MAVVAVMDGPRRSFAGRVGLALAVLLALSWSGSSLPPGTTGAPAAQPAVQATPQPQPQHRILGGQAPLVRTAARHSQRNRRGDALVAVMAAALAGTVVAATRRPKVARARHLDRRLFHLGPRAPPFPS